MPGVPPKAGRLVVPRQTTGHLEKVAAGPFGVASLSGGFLAGAVGGRLVHPHEKVTTMPQTLYGLKRALKSATSQSNCCAVTSPRENHRLQTRQQDHHD